MGYKGTLFDNIDQPTTLYTLMIMAASLSHLTETPVELLEQILLYLPSQDIVKMETVRGAATDLRWMNLC